MFDAGHACISRAQALIRTNLNSHLMLRPYEKAMLMKEQLCFFFFLSPEDLRHPAGICHSVDVCNVFYFLELLVYNLVHAG